MLKKTSLDSILYAKARNIRNLIETTLPPGSVIPAHTAQGHFYKVDENTYTSVTGALQLLKDPSLANWKMNRALEHVWSTLILKGGEPLDIAHLQMILAQAKNAPQEEFEEAGDIGKRIHDRREAYFSSWILNEERPPLSAFLTEGDDPRIWSGMRALSQFCDDTGYIPVVSELLVYSKKLGLAGTLDDLGLIDGDLVLMDLKSSNRFKNEYFLQVGLYYKMLKEITGLKPKRSFILKVSKDNGTYQIEHIPRIATMASLGTKVVHLDRGIQFIKECRKDNGKTIIKT